jgi:hypothetical protein
MEKVKTKDIGQVRIELSKMNCRVHLKLPSITRVGDELVYATCCDAFKSILEKRFVEILNEPPAKRVSLR